MEFQDKIKEIRRQLGKTQQEFGEMIGINQRTISGYETGVRLPSYKCMVLLNELLRKHKIRISLM